MSETTTGAAVILSKEQVNLAFIPGAPIGSKEEDEPDNVFTGDIIEPPFSPDELCKRVASSGELSAVMQAVADGCAGMKYEIVPRFTNVEATSKFDVKNPSTWPAEAMAQRTLLEILVQAGFVGKGAQSLRSGFREQELDRVILGWGGVVVHRETQRLKGQRQNVTGALPKPTALGKFEARYARFSRPGRNITYSPVPISLMDGTTAWIEEPRHFRRIRYAIGNNRFVWYKEFGDWRALDSRTGKFSTNPRHVPSSQPFTQGSYFPGALPSGGQPALEVMHWATAFPGAAPYGMSGWHSEITTVDSASEAGKLLLSFLKSGLHSVIIAAANRPFESATADAAIDKLDKLGRGREGLGALLTIALVPSSSDGVAANPFATDASADRGRLILHELNTKLPTEVMNGETRKSLGRAVALAERIPDLLLGRSDGYNFATSASMWSTVNRLRFSPHHEEREQFLDRILSEMGVQWWRIKVHSPEWSDRESVSGIATVVGQNGGLSVNRAVELLSSASGLEIKRVSEWWGDIPMPFVAEALKSPDPARVLRLLGFEEIAKKIEKEGVGDVVGQVASAVDAMNQTT